MVFEKNLGGGAHRARPPSKSALDNKLAPMTNIG